MDLYSENILDYYKNPRNKGVLEDATIWAEDSNPLCGDKIRIDLKIGPGNKITEIRFNSQGCAISQASASMLTELVHGKTCEEAAKIQNEDVYKMLGVPLSAVRVKCGLLGLAVLKKALALYKIDEKN